MCTHPIFTHSSFMVLPTVLHTIPTPPPPLHAALLVRHLFLGVKTTRVVPRRARALLSRGFFSFVHAAQRESHVRRSPSFPPPPHASRFLSPLALSFRLTHVHTARASFASSSCLIFCPLSLSLSLAHSLHSTPLHVIFARFLHSS